MRPMGGDMAPESFQNGGEGDEMRPMGGEVPPEMAPPQTGGSSLSPGKYGPGPFAKSQYYTISGGKGKRRGGSKCKHGKSKGGEGVLATAAVPFGLLALQRYFKGSKTSKKGVAKMGRTFKRTFRRRY